MHGLTVRVQLHVESLDVLGIVVKNDRAVEDLLSKVTLVLRSQINTPLDFVLELDLALFDFLLKNGDTLGVWNAAEGSIDDLLQSLDETLFNELIEKLEFLLVVQHDVVEAELEVILSTCHVIFQGGKSELGLNHPEFGQMASSVGVLGTEGGTECVNVREGTAIVLNA